MDYGLRGFAVGLITLKQMGLFFGWRGHSAYFNTQQYGFPEHKNVNEDGEKLYDYKEVYVWDRDRPLKPAETELPTHKLRNII